VSAPVPIIPINTNDAETLESAESSDNGVTSNTSNIAIGGGLLGLLVVVAAIVTHHRNKTQIDVAEEPSMVTGFSNITYIDPALRDTQHGYIYTSDTPDDDAHDDHDNHYNTELNKTSANGVDYYENPVALNEEYSPTNTAYAVPNDMTTHNISDYDAVANTNFEMMYDIANSGGIVYDSGNNTTEELYDLANNNNVDGYGLVGNEHQTGYYDNMPASTKTAYDNDGLDETPTYSIAKKQ
jgi:hypothetical protein